MTEMALMTGREVAELVLTIEEPMTLEGLRVVKEEVGVATLGVGEVGEEMEIMEEEGWKKAIEKMVKERREFPKEEFSGFGY